MRGTATLTFGEELMKILADGGFVMPPLVLFAILLWLGIGYRMMTLHRGSAAPVRTLLDNAIAGAITRSRGYVDTAAVVAAETYRRARGDIRRALDEELFFIDERLSRYRTLVRTIVVIAPLAGLLGTVTGMIEMFQSLGDQTFYSQSGGVANGISQALLTTQFGLTIAIPGMIVGRLMDRREDSMHDEILQIKELVVTKRGEKRHEASTA